MKTVYVYGNLNPFGFIRDRKWKEFFSIKKVIFQKSIFAFGGAAVPITSEMIDLGKKDGNKEHVYDDFTKSYAHEIIEDPADYIYVDLLACVIPVKEITVGGIKSFVTYNDNMKYVCEGLKAQKVLSMGQSSLNLAPQDIARKVNEFCDFLLKSYKQNQIIINLATYPDYYLYKGKIVSYDDRTKRQKSANKNLLTMIQGYIRTALPEACYVNMPEGVYSNSPKQPFAFSKEYMDYLASAVLAYMEPAAMQSQLLYDFGNMFSRMHAVADEGTSISVNIEQVVNEYEYKLELYNEKFRLYEEKFLEMYNYIMQTDYEFMPFDKNELSFTEFVDVKNHYLIKKSRKNHSKFWRIIVFPFTQIGNFFTYMRVNGFRKAIRKSRDVYKENLTDN